MTQQNGEPGGYRRMPRMREGRLLAGVCTGLARYTGIDQVVFRVGFVLLLIAGGQGGLLYIAAALLMPAGPDAAAPVERLLRRRFDGGGALTILAGLLAVCVLFNLTGSGLVGAGMSGDALSVVVVFALVLLTAHARNVDLVRVARTLPERLQGHPLARPPAPDTAGPATRAGSGGPVTEEMIDLATLTPHAAADAAAPPGTQPTQPTQPARPTWPTRPAPHARRPRRPARPASVLTPVTLLAALIAMSAVFPVAAPHGTAAAWQIVPAAALAVVGAGLLAGGWWGRGRGLATVGTILTFSLVTSTAVGEAPRGGRFGDVEWRPTDPPRGEQTYRLVAGSGTLDLTALPLLPGQRVVIRAETTFGTLDVRVPRDASVRLDAQASVGDITVDGRLTGGPNAKVSELLAAGPPAPGAAGSPAAKARAENPPVIELRVRARIGDVEVRRG